MRPIGLAIDAPTERVGPLWSLQQAEKPEARVGGASDGRLTAPGTQTNVRSFLRRPRLILAGAVPGPLQPLLLPLFLLGGLSLTYFEVVGGFDDGGIL